VPDIAAPPHSLTAPDQRPELAGLDEALRCPLAGGFELHAFDPVARDGHGVPEDEEGEELPVALAPGPIAVARIIGASTSDGSRARNAVSTSTDSGIAA
jgi:hypothetical protein